jgi:hypothetical protein
MVLGISTNTRLVSIALISQNSLVEHSITLHKSSWSPLKRDSIIASLEPCVRQYCIKSVVLSIPHAHHQTPAQKELSEAIKVFFQSRQIPVSTKTPEAFASLCPEGTKKYKEALMTNMVTRFAALKPYYHKEMRNKHRYYFKLFEAVAMAVLGESDRAE